MIALSDSFIMQKLHRVPIHANTPQGRLRRGRRQYPSVASELTNLSINNASPDKPTPPASVNTKQTRCKFFVRTKRQSLQPQQPPEGSFRAIHTAHEQDSIKGFPLRSVTPIRPYRRGIRAAKLPNFATVNLDDLKSRKTSYEATRAMPACLHTTIEDAITFHKPIGVGGEEFYKIKAPQPIRRSYIDEGNPSALSGKRIQPFFKYHTVQLRPSEGFAF